ncbi:MAG: rRNA maturation RNase YbeY [Flavobacteriaceae bacterium]|jgi:probable rRNA maturation factor|nr:rRNA maturation RNase YbeY [Flavobacteriaceae bacterium]MDO7590967.1 rRNA maturation RNase YbeY [Flavobacteriaceae bacterium]MDO7599475.1 rRNA maturation RNase YbeY [Flavobacteriaceae bacterium]MDO7602564.1 rRNA maturation RNase YbeY [Flavobacteriaceae bacterium]MDO7615135.1 rRNA maturation RNase YbeY [Flavobacteriaceae bacterium]|tara:strand:- start:2292 stop:2714 length:423 start_codon:yes stop_codon:yes gene_type:complete
MQKVRFYNLPTKTLSAKAVKDWVVKLANHYEVQIDNFAVNFINKEQMLEMNQKYLNHDTHTDILTFDYGNQHFINAELFVSEYMCSLNAEENAQTIENETLRLISHGFLHTLGFSDKKLDQKILMTEQEDLCLSMFHVKQ